MISVEAPIDVDEFDDRPGQRHARECPDVHTYDVWCVLGYWRCACGKRRSRVEVDWTAVQREEQ